MGECYEDGTTDKLSLSSKARYRECGDGYRFCQAKAGRKVTAASTILDELTLSTAETGAQFVDWSHCCKECTLNADCRLWEFSPVDKCKLMARVLGSKPALRVSLSASPSPFLSLCACACAWAWAWGEGGRARERLRGGLWVGGRGRRKKRDRER